MLAASGDGEELSQSLLGVVIGAVHDCGGGLVVFEGVDKLDEFLRRDSKSLVRWIGGEEWPTRLRIGDLCKRHRNWKS